MKSSSKKRLILYDLDGTIVDTREDIARAANVMLEKMGHAPLAHEAVCCFVGRGLHYLIEHCLGTTDAKTVEKGSRIYIDYYTEHMLDHTELYPGAKAFLEHFKDRHQAVITNKPDPFSVEILQALGVAGYFFKIVAGNGIFPRKPDPASTLVLMEEAGASPAETLWIGDSPVDIETAQAAGVETVVLSHGFTAPNELESRLPGRVLSDFDALFALAERESW